MHDVAKTVQRYKEKQFEIYRKQYDKRQYEPALSPGNICYILLNKPNLMPKSVRRYAGPFMILDVGNTQVLVQSLRGSTSVFWVHKNKIKKGLSRPAGLSYNVTQRKSRQADAHRQKLDNDKGSNLYFDDEEDGFIGEQVQMQPETGANESEDVVTSGSNDESASFSENEESGVVPLEDSIEQMEVSHRDPPPPQVQPEAGPAKEPETDLKVQTMDPQTSRDLRASGARPKRLLPSPEDPRHPKFPSVRETPYPTTISVPKPQPTGTPEKKKEVIYKPRVEFTPVTFKPSIELTPPGGKKAKEFIQKFTRGAKARDPELAREQPSAVTDPERLMRKRETKNLDIWGRRK